MQNVFLVRHGQSDANVQMIFDNYDDGHSLTELGRIQAQQTADYFSSKSIQAMFSSPILRARQTAEIISQKIGLSFEIMKEFKEFLIGDLNGLPMSGEAHETFHNVLDQWHAGNFLASFPNGENYHGLITRFRQGLQKITTRHPEGDLLVVAHGGLIIVGVQGTCPNVSWDFLMEKMIPHCSITHLKIQRDQGDLTCELVKWADTSHLSQDALSAKNDMDDLTEAGTH